MEAHHGSAGVRRPLNTLVSDLATRLLGAVDLVEPLQCFIAWDAVQLDAGTRTGIGKRSYAAGATQLVSER